MNFTLVNINLQKYFLEKDEKFSELNKIINNIAYVTNLFNQNEFKVINIFDRRYCSKTSESNNLVDKINNIVKNKNNVINLDKKYPNAFKDTELTEILNEKNNLVIFSGYSAEESIISTINSAQDKDIPFAILRGGIISNNESNIHFVENNYPLISKKVIKELIKFKNFTPESKNNQNSVKGINSELKIQSNDSKIESKAIVRKKKTANELKVELDKGKINNIIKVLVVDDDKRTALIIEKFLLKQKFNAVSVNSAIEGGTVLKEEFYDLVITDLNMPEVNGLEFMMWINEFSPKTEVIIMTALDSAEGDVKYFAEQQGVLKFLKKPVSLPNLKELIESTIIKNEKSDKAKYFELPDFVNMMILSKDKKLISITDPTTDKDGCIYILNGKICHAKFGDKIGKDAFCEIMTTKGGIFFDEDWQDPEKITITETYTELMTIVTSLNKNKEDKKEISSSIPKRAIGTNEIQAKDFEKFEDDTDENKKNVLYESGIAFGIIVGKTKKDEVLDILEYFIDIGNVSEITSRVMFFESITLNILFDENNIVEELSLGRNYEGQTSKGIKIGDSIEKAIKIYEPPKICTIKGAIWDTFSIFCENNRIISSIKLTKPRV